MWKKSKQTIDILFSSCSDESSLKKTSPIELGHSQNVEPKLHIATKKHQFFGNFSKNKAQKALQKLRAQRPSSG